MPSNGFLMVVWSQSEEATEGCAIASRARGFDVISHGTICEEFSDNHQCEIKDILLPPLSSCILCSWFMYVIVVAMWSLDLGQFSVGT